jgi:Right handed beta helix region
MHRFLKLSVLAVLLLPLASRGQILVDCSGSNPNAFPSINAALPGAFPGSTILVTGTCNENVTLEDLDNVSLGAYSGQTATINGGLVVSDSKLIYLYGLNVTNAPFDGIAVVHSTSVTIDSCTSNGNGQVGLAVRHLSEVTVLSSGAFDNNVGHGIFLDGNSRLLLIPFAGQLDISNNGANGVNLGPGSFETWGNTNISNNAAWGIQMTGGGRAQVAAIFGQNTIQGNPLGGVSATEGSEISLYGIFDLPNVIQGNGPVGVSVGLGSQATLAFTDQISGHSSTGVEAYANSQVNFLGSNSVFGNGSAGDSRSGGVRVDGNSEVLIRGGDLSHNNGPGILALVNSSADFSGATFSGDIGGVISCDSSSTMVSDIANPNWAPPNVHCKTPHSLGNRRFSFTAPRAPDISIYKARQARYRKIATRH